MNFPTFRDLIISSGSAGGVLACAIVTVSKVGSNLAGKEFSGGRCSQFLDVRAGLFRFLAFRDAWLGNVSYAKSRHCYSHK
jgi:hypothetical protein